MLLIKIKESAHKSFDIILCMKWTSSQNFGLYLDIILNLLFANIVKIETKEEIVTEDLDLSC